MNWIIGIDGGGTKTVACAAALDGRVLARTEKGAANYHIIGLPSFKDLIGSIIDELGLAAHLEKSGLVLVSLGLAGADRDRDRELLAAALLKLGLGDIFLISSDARIALAAALGDRAEGIVLIAGTGSIAYGVTRGGETIRAGGWGHIISDEGSGYDIGRQALTRGIKAWEGRDKQSSLLSMIMDRLGLTDMADLIGFIHNPATTKAKIAAIADTVLAAADDGDELAADIISVAADNLADLVGSVIDRGFPGSYPVPVAIYGGLLQASPGLRQHLATRLAGRAVFLSSGPEPVMGALKIGYDYLRRT